MKLLSIIFFAAAVILIIFAILVFCGKLKNKTKESGLSTFILGLIIAICGFVALSNSLKGLVLILSSVLLINAVYIISKNDGDKKCEIETKKYSAVKINPALYRYCRLQSGVYIILQLI
ncbi:MAG: hypothetical protein IKL10_00695 [Clostridia bacterium]|nr:hypothetical protein [Clostridia bacterium]